MIEWGGGGGGGYNPVYCIHVPGHDPLIFSFLSFILFDWVGVLWPKLTKVLKPVRWAGSVQLGLIPAVEEGVNVSVFPAPSCSLLDLIPPTTTSVCLHTKYF